MLLENELESGDKYESNRKKTTLNPLTFAPSMSSVLTDSNQLTSYIDNVESWGFFPFNIIA